MWNGGNGEDWLGIAAVILAISEVYLLFDYSFVLVGLQMVCVRRIPIMRLKIMTIW